MMSDTPTLRSPLVSVVLDDGAEHTVQTDNRDLLAYERTAAKHKWPQPSVAPFGWLTFLAWHALRREGATAYTLDDFEAHCVSVASGGDDEGDDDDVTPTQPGAEPD